MVWNSSHLVGKPNLCVSLPAESLWPAYDTFSDRHLFGMNQLTYYMAAIPKHLLLNFD